MRKSTETFGVVIANRSFFPDRLAETGRQQILDAIENAGYRAVVLSPEKTSCGAVETREDAERCADLFRAHRDEISGILIALPNFGDERSAADVVRLSNLGVPVLIHAFPDDLDRLDAAQRRDAFCGKLSLANCLRQYGIPFSTTSTHVLSPEDPTYPAELHRFAAVCRVVNRIRSARVGLVGARPAAFNTVRFSEKLLERVGISVETIDLSEMIARAKEIEERDPLLKSEIDKLTAYISTDGVPEPSIRRMAALSLALSRWADENRLDAMAVQCWTALEKLYGIVPCAAMSMLSERLIPAACEADVMGALSMYALSLASGSPAALLDWNNNYGADPDKAVTFHCSNLPKSFFEKTCMSYQAIIADEVGAENTFGTCVGRIQSGPATFLRLSSDDVEARIACYIAVGEYTDDPLETFGGFGVVRVDDLSGLLTYIVENGFEHHVAVTRTCVAEIVEEALAKYLGWSVYRHPSDVASR